MDALQLALDTVYLKDSTSSCPTTSTTAEPTTCCSLVNEEPRVDGPDSNGELPSGVENRDKACSSERSSDQRSEIDRYLSSSSDGAAQVDSNQIPQSPPPAAHSSPGIKSRPLSSESRCKASESISPGLATLISSSPKGKQASKGPDIVPGTTLKERSPEEVNQSPREDDQDDDFFLGQEALEEIELLEKESMAKESSLTEPGTRA